MTTDAGGFYFNSELARAVNDPETPIYGQMLRDYPDTAAILHPWQLHLVREPSMPEHMALLFGERLAFAVLRPENLVRITGL